MRLVDLWPSSEGLLLELSELLLQNQHGARIIGQREGCIPYKLANPGSIPGLPHGPPSTARKDPRAQSQEEALNIAGYNPKTN